MYSTVRAQSTAHRGSITNWKSRGQPRGGGGGAIWGNFYHPSCGCKEGLQGESRKLTSVLDDKTTEVEISQSPKTEPT